MHKTGGDCGGGVCWSKAPELGRVSDEQLWLEQVGHESRDLRSCGGTTGGPRSTRLLSGSQELCEDSGCGEVGSSCLPWGSPA